MIHTINKFTKNIRLLGKFGILPKIIFVMILKNKCDVSFLCIRQTSVYAIRCNPYAFVN